MQRSGTCGGRRRGALRLATLATTIAAGLFGPAQAQDATPDAGSGVDNVLKMLNLKADVGPAADFVQASRPKGKTDFIPIGTQHPTRPVKVKTPAELQAAEADLDAARIKQDKLAGVTPADPKAATPRPKPRRGAATSPTRN